MAAVLAAFSLGASAQNMYDAINMSRNEYFGSARSMALGNAVTALGGDLGMIGINPAGSAVASYGQFAITPGLSISSVSSLFDAGEARAVSSLSSRAKTTLPNWGISAVFNTGRREGLKSFTFAVTSNRTSQYLSYANAYGTNSRTSKLAELAAAAGGIGEEALGKYNSFDYTGIAWDILTGYQAGMFGSYGIDGEYVAVTEALDADGRYHYVPGTLSQTSVVQKMGYKNDLVINMGFNVSDKLYFGVNVGVPSSRYEYDEAFYESAVDQSLFPLSYQNGDTYFQSASTGYRYVATMDGVYAKFGIIARPFAGLRLGAAVQTPTDMTVYENWQYSASTYFADSYFDADQTSPVGDYSYRLISPYILNFGAAYTFGRFGLVSVDYEMMDYSVMRFADANPDYMAKDIFRELNETNRNFARQSHNLRVGVEVNVLPGFAVRAGWDMLTSPERYWSNDRSELVFADDFLAEYNLYASGAKRLLNRYSVGDKITSWSLGFGYASSGSFFADFAIKFTRYPDSKFFPYYDYPNWDAYGDLVNVDSPVILNSRNMTSASLTFGWRF